MRIAAAVAVLFLLLPAIASARQYRVNNGGHEQIAHTRLAPVLVHRALPPFWGEHVYAGRNK